MGESVSSDHEAFMAGADFMKQLKDAEIRNLHTQLADMRLQLTELYDRKGWLCGCDHTNGINLALCAACGRKPNGERP